MAERPFSVKRTVHNSIMAMDKLGYDPITELLNNRERILVQIQYYEDWRTGKLVPLDRNCKEKAYFPKEHMLLFDKLTKIDEALLRYRYARVPEPDNVEKTHASSLIVNLTHKGNQHVINAEETDGD